MVPEFYALNSEFVFYFEAHELIVIDPRKQRVFKIYDKNFLKRLLDISSDIKSVDPSNPIDASLIESGLLIQGRINDSWQGDKLSKLSHLASRNLSHHYPLLSQSMVQDSLFQLADNIEEVPTVYQPSFISEKIHLPEPELDKLTSFSLDCALRQRKTCREFFGTSASLSDLGTLLYYSLGSIHGQEWDEFNESQFVSLGKRKSSPSSSGLQACDGFIVVMNVTGLENGIYFYHDQDHSLQKVHESISNDLLSSLVFDQFWVEGIAFGIFITIDLRKAWIKDVKTRGYVTTYIECGHVSQTIQLVSTALNLQTWITGSFRDDLLSATLNIQEDFIFPCFFIGMGNGSNNSIPIAFR